MDDLLREFLTETNEALDTLDTEIVRFEQEPNNTQVLGRIFRLVHTIKGTCGFLDLPRLEALAHAAETLMGRYRDGAGVKAEGVTLILATLDRIKAILGALEATGREPAGDDTALIDLLAHMAAGLDVGASVDAAEVLPAVDAAILDELLGESAEPGVARQSIRVGVNTLERLMTMVSELVLTRNQLLDIARRQAETEFQSPLQRLSSVTAELQDGVMKTRMQPIASAWQRLPRMVRDLGRLLGKSIVLQTYGEDTELDRQVLDLVRDPLTHMVRNAADHGLEMPDERRERRKAATGTIRLSARHEGAHILIEIADDGRGLNTARIREKALAAGLATPAQLERMTDAQAQRFIFSPGFSTAAAVTSISGRGVGMDVVKANIEQIGGSVEVTSIAGAGTAFLLRIPLTLAIVSALIVQADGERYAVPQLAVSELVRARAGTEARIERIKGAAILRLRERLLPLLHLGGVFATGTDDPAQDDGRLVVVMQAGGQPFGVAVDRIFHTEEIVVKPLASALRDIGFFSGNTILGDGSVILILDPNGLAETLGDTTEIVRELAQLMPVPAAAAEPTVPLLVFRAGSRDPKAVPLSLVTRLEEVAPERIESADGREMIQYRDRLMPVVRIAPPAATGQGAQPLLVVAHESAMMGILVDEIVDIVEAPARVALPSARPGSLGSAVLNGRATEMIDVGHFVAAAFPDGAPAPLGPGARSGLPLLLVDDSPFFRDMLRPLLQAAGYTVSVVASGEEALGHLARDASAAAIIADLDMPQMSGVELAALVKRDPRTADIPLIALGAHPATPEPDALRAAGFEALVTKFDRPGLIAAVKSATVDLGRVA